MDPCHLPCPKPGAFPGCSQRAAEGGFVGLHRNGDYAVLPFVRGLPLIGISQIAPDESQWQQNAVRLNDGEKHETGNLHTRRCLDPCRRRPDWLSNSTAIGSRPRTGVRHGRRIRREFGRPAGRYSLGKHLDREHSRSFHSGKGRGKAGYVDIRQRFKRRRRSIHDNGRRDRPRQ